MKRSSMIFLGATGILIAGAWLGRSTGPLGTEEKANIYDNVNACIVANVLTRNQCEAEFAAAREKHLTEAPRFQNSGACEAQYGSGQCQPATIAGTSYFLPVMAGILAGQMLANRRPAQALLPPLRNQQSCAPGFTPATQPGCVVPRSSSSSSSSNWRSYSTAGGAAISRNTSGPSTVTVPRGTVTTRSTSGPSSAAAPSSSVTRGGFGSTARSTSASSSS